MAPTADFCGPWWNLRIVVIIVLFVITIITATITTAVKDAAMIVVQDAVLFGVTQSAPSLLKVETVRATFWRGFLARCGPGFIAANVAKVKEAGHLPRAHQGQWFDGNVLDLPRIAQRAFNELGRLTARQLWHGVGGLDGGCDE